MSLGVVGALTTSGIILQRPRVTRTAVHVAEAVVYTKAVTGLAKGVIGRTRPFATADPLALDDVEEIATAHRDLAMPSGHTSRAFAMASVLSHEFDRWYVSVPAYGFATSVGLQRIHSGDHWLTDAVVGAALGYAIGRIVADPPSAKGQITYQPIASPGRVGVSVRF
jgi:membrane-associated phospholipid phosphatase